MSKHVLIFYTRIFGHDLDRFLFARLEIVDRLYVGSQVPRHRVRLFFDVLFPVYRSCAGRKDSVVRSNPEDGVTKLVYDGLLCFEKKPLYRSISHYVVINGNDIFRYQSDLRTTSPGETVIRSGFYFKEKDKLSEREQPRESLRARQHPRDAALVQSRNLV